MKYEAPSSYTNDPGLLTLDGDEDFELLKKAFRRNYLKLIPREEKNVYEVRIDKNGMGLLQMFEIFIMSKATYLYVYGEDSVSMYKRAVSRTSI